MNLPKISGKLDHVVEQSPAALITDDRSPETITQLPASTPRLPRPQGLDQRRAKLECIDTTDAAQKAGQNETELVPLDKLVQEFSHTR